VSPPTAGPPDRLPFAAVAGPELGTIMKRLFIIVAGAGAAAAMAAGCSSSSTGSSSTAPSSASSSGGAAMVRTASSSLGQILVDGSGRTLYLFKPDGTGKPTCTGQCSSIWPPETTTGQPQASGVPSGMLGTVTRSDNSMQVTVNGHPLYHFSHDSKPGDVNGQGVQGIWFAVSPCGNPVTSTGVGSSPSSPGGPSSSSAGGGGGYGY
jgi:predicted lipoprotein with Yx(FWY)xxD motif